MAEPILGIPLTLANRAEQVFPTLTEAQMARIAAHGRRRPIQPGEVLLDLGDQLRFFVVTKGRIDILGMSGSSESLIVRLTPGQFTGEVNLLSGRRGFTRIRATEAGEVIEVDREHLLTLIQTDTELSDILMRAFILRRVELISHQIGDVVLLGSTYSPDTLRIREFLTRNGYPHAYIDLDKNPDAQELLDRFHVKVQDIPVVMCRGRSVLRNPTNREIADCLGFNEAVDQTHLRDLVIVGAGPAGLAAAVYGASEGLDVLGHRIRSAGRPGWFELEDRKLPWFSNRDFRPGIGRASLCAGAEIWRPNHDRQMCKTPRLRSQTLLRSNWTTDKAFPPAQSLSPLARGIASCPSTMPGDSKAQAFTTAPHSLSHNCALTKK